MNWPAWLVVLLAVGATTRLTRLINGDTLTEPIRTWLLVKAVHAEDRTAAGRNADPGLNELPARRRTLPEFFKAKWGGFWPWLDDLVNCPWCVSCWIGIIVGYVAVYFHDNRFILGGLVACTASYVAGYTIGSEPSHDDDEGDD